jgi:hypothetical protein
MRHYSLRARPPGEPSSPAAAALLSRTCAAAALQCCSVACDQQMPSQQGPCRLCSRQPDMGTHSDAIMSQDHPCDGLEGTFTSAAGTHSGQQPAVRARVRVGGAVAAGPGGLPRGVLPPHAEGGPRRSLMQDEVFEYLRLRSMPCCHPSRLAAGLAHLVSAALQRMPPHGWMGHRVYVSNAETLTERCRRHRRTASSCGSWTR